MKTTRKQKATQILMLVIGNQQKGKMQPEVWLCYIFMHEEVFTEVK